MKTTAVIVDVDGTLVDVSGILHYVDGSLGQTKSGRPIKNFDKFHAASAFCPPNRQAIEYCERMHAAGHELLIVTARMEQWREVTTKWLNAELTVPYLGPFMRRDRDYRRDVDIKTEIHAALTEHHDIVGAIDDNPNVIELWRSLDILTEVVARPDWDTSLLVQQANTDGARR
ncbi:HAD family acid phosphatase [Rhodococcus sp. 05-2255-3B1]|uniref:phosphatase domain-containing protein n=1 Tax=Rhodococcus sp. 05-2255-3B1 TaxID=2022482 RepID=UPI00211AF049|nr:HAD family acid phosphatase [Rhodococcus sp. 05-2255-3B1]